LAATYDSAKDLVRSGTPDGIDVFFLDVEMPEMTGLELLETMKEPPLVVLVTSKADYAVDAFAFDVVDYLLKPVTFPRFAQAVQRIEAITESRIETDPEEDHVFVKSDGKLMKVDLIDIEWIEAQRDYVLIHTDAQDYFIHSTMKRLEARLSAPTFLRVHRSFIVRLDKIEDIQDGSILIGKKVIPVGASYKDDLLSRINML